MDIITEEVEEHDVAADLDAMNQEERAKMASFKTIIPMTCLLNGANYTKAMVMVWSLNYPFNIYESRKIVQLARTAPKSVVLSYLFIDKELDSNESHIFDILYDYGQASGIIEVGRELYVGASQGDPRAVKMYLELMRMLNQDDTEEQAIKKLMKISMDI